MRNAVRDIIQSLGLDEGDPNFVGTPARVADMYEQITGGLVDTETKIDEVLSSTFPCDHDQMIVARGIDVYGICPHHLLPVHYSVAVAYLPGAPPNDSVVGLSKLYRLVEILAARPVLQERMVNDVADSLMRIPGCQGAGVIVHGEHMCIQMRGVRQVNSVVTTSSLRGVFLEGDVRSEFMSLCGAL